MFNVLLRFWPQWFATIIVTLLNISIGLALGWTSPYLAQLTDENAPFRVTEEEAAWIASLLPLGRLLGAIIGSFLVEIFDSKISVLLTGLPLIFSWICTICSTSATWLYIFRIFSGMSMGMVFTCYPLYIGEISAPSIRGALVCLIINGFPMGSLLGTIMGPNMSMMYFGIISLILTLCYMSIFPFLPQSPHYYVRRNDTERAKRAIQWYQQKSDVRSDMEDVEQFVKSTCAMSRAEQWQQIKEPKNRRSLVMIVLLFMFMQLSGLNTIIFYAEIIVRKAKVTLIAPSSIVIIVNAVCIIFGWIGAFVIDRCGRRILLAISSLGVFISMLLLGFHFLLLEYDYDPGDIEWVIILSLTLIFPLMSLGLTPVPSAMLSEIFPSSLKSTAGFVSGVTGALFAFVASRTYQPLIDLIGEKYVFWIYAAIIATSLVYSLTVVPETKGKTLQEIQDMMAAGNTKKSSQKTHVEDIQK
ncbi:hypothetical protein P5V15_014303 [Pogonomyrmex californicus]